MIKSTKDAALILRWIFRIFPSFAFGSGIIRISARQIMTRSDNQTTPYEPFDFDIAGADLMLLGLSSIFYFLLVFLIEKLNNSHKF